MMLRSYQTLNSSDITGNVTNLTPTKTHWKSSSVVPPICQLEEASEINIHWVRYCHQIMAIIFTLILAR